MGVRKGVKTVILPPL